MHSERVIKIEGEGNAKNLHGADTSLLAFLEEYWRSSFSS
jgi:hypothetical protein